MTTLKEAPKHLCFIANTEKDVLMAFELNNEEYDTKNTPSKYPCLITWKEIGTGFWVYGYTYPEKPLHVKYDVDSDLKLPATIKIITPGALISFGTHKGKPAASIEASYLLWADKTIEWFVLEDDFRDGLEIQNKRDIEAKAEAVTLEPK